MKFQTFGSMFNCWSGIRSEEHTSELQSHSDLVCRLLLEKKKPEASARYRFAQQQHAVGLLVPVSRVGAPGDVLDVRSRDAPHLAEYERLYEPRLHVDQR